MTLAECAQKGIDKIRKAHWANPKTYVKIDIIDDGFGPWGHLYDLPIQTDVLRVESPQNFIIAGDNANDWVEFTP